MGTAWSGTGETGGGGGRNNRSPSRLASSRKRLHRPMPELSDARTSSSTICTRCRVDADERNSDSTSMSRRVEDRFDNTGQNGRGSALRRRTNPTAKRRLLRSYLRVSSMIVGRLSMCIP